MAISSLKQNGKDDFGSDPFAVLHAPPKGSEPQDSPALPPKAKSKPPRPAPPRPAQGPKPSSNNDSFGSFANFDDFDNKVS
jgi:epidermal growth factor receptor substrate 15